MYFRLLHDEASGAMSYLLADLARAEAVLVDPRGLDLPVLRALLNEHQLQLRWQHGAHRAELVVDLRLRCHRLHHTPLPAGTPAEQGLQAP